MDKLKRDKLVQIIEEAFADTPSPTDDNIGYDLKELKGHKWQSLPINIIRLRRDDFHNMSPQAYRYFLPALMRAVIIYPDEVDTLVDTIVNLLSPTAMIGEHQEQLKKQLDKRIVLFTEKEKQAVHAFLEAYLELEPEVLHTSKELQDVYAAIKHWS